MIFHIALHLLFLLYLILFFTFYLLFDALVFLNVNYIPLLFCVNLNFPYRRSLKEHLMKNVFGHVFGE